MTDGDFKKTRVDEALRRKKMRRIFFVLLIILLAVILTAGVFWYGKRRQKNLPGQFLAEQGREHVGLEHVFSYNSNPPTSGPHFSKEAEWGVYKEELADRTVIHNLEHGGIWISYKPDISEEIRKKLESFYDEWGRKIIVTPRSQNDSDIALAAWNRLDKFSASEYSDERVDKFIRAFRNKGPEFVP